MTTRSIVATTALGLSLLLTGCNTKAPAGAAPAAAPPAKQAGLVAIVNSEEVVKALGWNTAIENKLKETNATATATLEEFRKLQKKRLDDNVAALATTAGLDDKEKEELAKIENAADLEKITKLKKEHRDEWVKAVVSFNMSLQQRQRELSAEVEVARRNLLMGYREDLRQPARRVAEKRGFSVVLVTPVDPILHFDKEVDITNQVIDELANKRATEVAPK